VTRLHADLGGRIQANKDEAERLAADMKAVEAVIKMFDPDYSVRAPAAETDQHCQDGNVAAAIPSAAIA